LKNQRENNMKKLIFIQLAIVLLLTSCLVGRRYTRPELKVPEKYVSGDTLVVTGDTTSALAAKDTTMNLQWFELFSDTVLNHIITIALDSNTNLNNAILRVEQSRSLYKNSKAKQWPSVGYKAAADINDPQTDNFELLGTASWELDFWGKIRHAKRAAYAEMIASQEGLKTIKTTIVSDVASLYFLIRDLDSRIEITQQTIGSRKTYYEMVNQRFLKGESAELDKLQAEQQLALAEATLSSLQRELGITERSMNILLGQNPQPIPRGVANADQVVIPEVPAGLPSTLLEHRPDVVAAENTLIAETEKIGVYQAMRFPSFSLTGVLGVASTDVNSLLTGDAFTAGVSGLVLGPIFEFGTNKRRVDIQKAEAEIAVNNYLNTYRTALADVENSLVSIQSYREEYAARQRQVQAARRALMLTKAKYDAGFTSYLEVLIAESYAFDAELLASFTRGQQLTSTVSLYRALGGGW
jgi:outer membrane protein, multidrug efflux system